MRIIAPISAIKIADKTFTSGTNGPGGILSASVTIGYDARASSCSFSIYDPDHVIGASFFEQSFAAGGLFVSDELLNEPQQTQSSTASSSSASGQGAVNKELSPRMRAFLDVLAHKETGGRGNDGYNILNGGEPFDSYAKHPKRIGRNGVTDSAGRYQFKGSTWDEEAAKAGAKDFTPKSQDRVAAQYIRTLGQESKIESGNWKDAVPELRGVWTSLPGAAESHWTMAEAEKVYEAALKKHQQQSGATGAATSSPGSAKSEGKFLIDKADTKPQEISIKGTEIVIGFGYAHLDQIVQFNFIHTGTNSSGKRPDVTTFEGKSVRWLLTRRKVTTAYTNISLKQLAQKVAKSYGLRLQMDGGDNYIYSYLIQSGISDFELLYREAKAVGYRIYDTRDVLILEPFKPNFTGFVIDRDTIDEISFSDQAVSEKEKPGTVSAVAGDKKIEVDRKTGVPEQQQKENSTATGRPLGQVKVTGEDKNKVKATVKDDKEVVTIPKTNTSQTITLSTGQVVTPDQLKAEKVRIERGYQSTATFHTVPEVLTLQPGDVIGISQDVIHPVFSREWMVDTLTHSFDAGSGMKTTVNFFSPQLLKELQENAVEGSSGGQTANGVTPVSTGSFIYPYKASAPVGDGVGYIPSRGRNHNGIDVPIPDGTETVASADGRVITSVGNCSNNADGCGGGAGNNVSIEHNMNGTIYVTRYFHMNSSPTVSSGDIVKQGQVIGYVGNSGSSRNSHGHFEIRKGSEYGQAIAPSDVGLNVGPPTGGGRT